MGMYRCPLKDKLKPKSHDEWHGDMCSHMCPIVRSELYKALENENWKRMEKLLKMIKDNFSDD